MSSEALAGILQVHTAMIFSQMSWQSVVDFEFHIYTSLSWLTVLELHTNITTF